MTTRKIDTKAISNPTSSYVGKRGELFYDTVTRSLRISDGVTPGGNIPVAWPVANTTGATGPTNIAIGQNAGGGTMGPNGVSIGTGAGQANQGNAAVAIGQGAGAFQQGAATVAIGVSAGSFFQSSNAVAIGTGAGLNQQGNSSIAIGNGAGAGLSWAQAAHTIIINASGHELDGVNGQTNSFYVAPVRGVTSTNSWTNPANTLPTGFYFMAYNPANGEIIYWY